MNLESFNTSLRSTIRDLLAMPENSVRPYHQNAPIYKGEEYITVQIQSEVAEGTDNTRLESIADETLFASEHLWGQRLLSANIQYYNGDAMLQLRSLATRMQSGMATQRFEDAGLGFIRTTLTDLTGLLPDEEWQTRAILRFDFYAAVEDEVKTPLIVKLPLTFHSGRGTTEVIVPPGGHVGGVLVEGVVATPWLVFEAGTGETIRLQEVIP